jgi:hypothetical protein
MSYAEIKTQHSARDVASLLLVIAATLLTAEIATRSLLLPASRIERKIDAERLALRSDHSVNSVLIVGNSLVQDGVLANVVGAALGGSHHVQRYAVAQTTFWDWRYALEGIVKSDSTPKTVLLLMSPEHFMIAAGRPDYSALRLIRTQELRAYINVLDLHPTEQSRILFSHFSAYFGFRNELRKNVIGRIVPGVPELMLALNAGAKRTVTINQERISARLTELNELMRTHGKRLLVGSPPLPSRQETLLELCQAAAVANVECLVPDNLAAFAASDFRDGFHLGPEGAKKYSRLLGLQLARVLNR